VQPIAALAAQQPSQHSASDWVMPGTEWGVQDSACDGSASAWHGAIVHGNETACSMAVHMCVHVRSGVIAHMKRMLYERACNDVDSIFFRCRHSGR
jgi:hypothetical protein